MRAAEPRPRGQDHRSRVRRDRGRAFVPVSAALAVCAGAGAIHRRRVVEAITSLVDTEASSDNEWLPLQKQWKYCTDLLEDIASGKQKLPLEEANPDREEASVAVIAPVRFFDLRGL